MEEILISIIVISYNAEATILETLKSIENQSYRNIEIIVADDGSTDNTETVVKRWHHTYLGKYGVKLLFSGVNRGVPANINLGIRASSGSLIKVLAADDLLVENAIEKFYYYYKLTENKKIIYQSKVEPFGEGANTKQNYFENAYSMINQNMQYTRLLKNYFLVSPGIGLLERKVLFDNGLYNEKYTMFEDYPFYLKLSKNGYEFRLINEELVKYRVSFSSISNSKKFTNTAIRFCHSSFLFFWNEKLIQLIRVGMIKEAILQGYQVTKGYYGARFLKLIHEIHDR